MSENLELQSQPAISTGNSVELTPAIKIEEAVTQISEVAPVTAEESVEVSEVSEVSEEVVFVVKEYTEFDYETLITGGPYLVYEEVDGDEELIESEEYIGFAVRNNSNDQVYLRETRLKETNEVVGNSVFEGRMEFPLINGNFKLPLEVNQLKGMARGKSKLGKEYQRKGLYLVSHAGTHSFRVLA